MNTIKDKAKEAQREYQRAWRKKNPEKVKEYNRRYWERKFHEMEAQTATRAAQ